MQYRITHENWPDKSGRIETKYSIYTVSVDIYYPHAVNVGDEIEKFHKGTLIDGTLADELITPALVDHLNNSALEAADEIWTNNNVECPVGRAWDEMRNEYK